MGKRFKRNRKKLRSDEVSELPYKVFEEKTPSAGNLTTEEIIEAVRAAQASHAIKEAFQGAIGLVQGSTGELHTHCKGSGMRFRSQHSN